MKAIREVSIRLYERDSILKDIGDSDFKETSKEFMQEGYFY